MTHALVVGGTGMLRRVTGHLLGRANTVSVVARSRERIVSIRNAGETDQGTTNAIAVDWRDIVALTTGVEEAIHVHGAISVTVCWIHSNSPDAPFAILNAMRSQARPPEWFQIYGSGGRRECRDAWHSRLSANERIEYRRITLGSISTPLGRRWLTDQEIEDGVIDAINAHNSDALVGDVRYDPLDRRGDSSC